MARGIGDVGHEAHLRVGARQRGLRQPLGKDEERGETGALLVEEYVAERYPNVRGVRFTMHVAIDEQNISTVMVDDADFMASVWAEVDRALIGEGAEPSGLTRYQVLDANGAEYHFFQYDSVPDFPIPQ